MPAHCAAFVGISLDGFLARPDGALDWLSTFGPAGDTGYDAFIDRTDALVMGRGTFETVRGFGGAWPYGDAPVLVLSSTPTAVDTSGLPAVQAADLSPAGAVARLEAHGLHRLYVDGGETVRRFLRADLIDEITLTQLPILIGSGLRLWGDLPGDVPLRRVETRTLGDSVQTRYRVIRPGAPAV